MADERFELNINLGDSTFQAAGDAERVMAALAEFKAMVETASPRRSRAPQEERGSDGGGGSAGSSDGSDSGSQAVPPDMNVPLAVFTKRDWKSQAAKATAIVMWAKYRDSKAALKPSEIEAYWRKTSGKAPANPSQVCTNAVTQGWLHGEGGGQYSVTQHGEDMVNGVARQ